LLRVETFGQGSLVIDAAGPVGSGFGRFPDCLSTAAAARLIHDFAWPSAGIGTPGAGGRIPVEEHIRRAGIEDLAALVPVVRACFADGWGESALASALRGREARAWVVLREAGPDSALVGFVLARRITELVEIDLVGVEPRARRDGVAARLLKRLLEVEAGEGLVEARLELSSQNAPAAALYAALGFVVVGRRPRYYPDGSDALLLSRFFG
jgi:ribosomal-protein-alanine N-acetyltransferase